MNNIIKKLRTTAGLTQEELAQKLDVHPQSVWAWEHGKTTPKGKRLKALADFFGVSEELIKSPQLKRTVAVLGTIPAGIPLESIEDIIDYEDIPNSWQGEYFGLRVRGDSMFPKYLDGDTIIVKVQSTCDNGQDCVVQVNGFDATLKSVYIKDGYFELRPYNKKYDVLRFADIRILGVVKEIRRKV